MRPAVSSTTEKKVQVAIVRINISGCANRHSSNRIKKPRKLLFGSVCFSLIYAISGSVVRLVYSRAKVATIRPLPSRFPQPPGPSHAIAHALPSVSAVFRHLPARFDPLMADDATAWKPLFNGQDLSGWKAVNGPIRAGMPKMACFTATVGAGGWLATTDNTRISSWSLNSASGRGNSGVFLRAPERQSCFRRDGIQVLDDDSPLYAKSSRGSIAAVYGLAAAKLGAAKRPASGRSI